MAQPIPCDLHDEPVRANYLIQDLDTGETIGVCALHAKPWGDYIQERIEEVYAGQDAGGQEPEPTVDPVPDPVADGDGDQDAELAREEPAGDPADVEPDPVPEGAEPPF